MPNVVWRKKYSIALTILGVLLFLLVVGFFSIMNDCDNAQIIADLLDKDMETIFSLAVAFFGIDLADKWNIGDILRGYRHNRENPPNTSSLPSTPAPTNTPTNLPATMDASDMPEPENPT